MHISMNGVQGAPDWKGYETDLWRLSEELREFFRNNRKLRGKNAFLDAIVRIASDSRFGKGRQNFVLILGEFGKGEYGDVLGKLLSDVDVYGHALKGLIRGKTLGYERSVAAILEKEKLGWIRSAAKKYLGLSNE